MEVAFVVQEHPDRAKVETAPWFCFAQDLANSGIFISKFDSLSAAWRPFDAMILMVWLDWENRQHFPSRRADLEQIAKNGQLAALSYDARARILRFFESVAMRTAAKQI